MGFTSRRSLRIEIDSNEVNVFADHKPLKYYGGNFNGNSYTREQIDLSNTETKLFRQGGESYSIEVIYFFFKFSLNNFLLLFIRWKLIALSFFHHTSVFQFINQDKKWL